MTLTSSESLKSTLIFFKLIQWDYLLFVYTYFNLLYNHFLSSLSIYSDDYHMNNFCIYNIIKINNADSDIIQQKKNYLPIIFLTNIFFFRILEGFKPKWVTFVKDTIFARKSELTLTINRLIQIVLLVTFYIWYCIIDTCKINPLVSLVIELELTYFCE